MVDPVTEKDLTVGDLGTPDAVVWVGSNACEFLRAFGTVTFYIDEAGCVRVANPLNVYLTDELAHPPEGVEPTFVRPILSDRKPQYVARKPDGSLWEVEYRKKDD